MAATCSITRTKDESTNYKQIGEVTFDWVADVDGDCSSESIDIYGHITNIITVPDGDNAPTADYDLSLIDSDQADILGGAGANRSATATERAIVTGGYVAGSCSLKIENAGNGGAGTVRIIYQS